MKITNENFEGVKKTMARIDELDQLLRRFSSESVFGVGPMKDQQVKNAVGFGYQWQAHSSGTNGDYEQLMRVIESTDGDMRRGVVLVLMEAKNKLISALMQFGIEFNEKK